MREIELVEGHQPVIVQLEDETGVALSQSGFVNAERLGRSEWSISTTTKIGVASIGGVIVRVQPKIPIRRLFFLLGYAHKPGWQKDLVTMRPDADLVPALAHAFVLLSERALNLGLLQGYREVEDSLPVLRGRLRAEEQLRRRFGLATSMLVRYDDYQTDIAENRMLRGATDLLLQLPDVPAKTRARLRRIRQTLADVEPPIRGAPLPKWQPNRLNERYQPALWFAELILRRDATTTNGGNLQLSGLVINMAKVFEDFVCTALGSELQRITGRCRTQARHHLDVDSQIAIRPDLVWYESGRPIAVVDAKYKAEKPAGFPDSDLYQMLAYCTALDLREGHLVYAKGNADAVSHTVRHTAITILPHTLDLDVEADDLLSQMSNIAKRVAISLKTQKN